MKSKYKIHPRLLKERRSRNTTFLACIFFVLALGVGLALYSFQNVEKTVSEADFPQDSISLFFEKIDYVFSPEEKITPLPLPTKVAAAPENIALLAAQPESQIKQPALLLASLGERRYSSPLLPSFIPDSFSEAAQAEATPSEEQVAFFPDFNQLLGAIEKNIAPKLQIYPNNDRYMYAVSDTGEQVLYSNVNKGDTAGIILNEWMTQAEINAMMKVAEPLYSLKTIRVGQPFHIQYDPSTETLLRFEYEIDNSTRLIVERNSANPSEFSVSKERIEYDRQLAHVKGSINSSLFESVADQGESPVLAINLADVFSCEVNFVLDIREGDSYEVLVEKRFRDGEFKGYGPILAARFVNQDKQFDAYLYTNAEGKLRHYNAQGEALQKALLKSPLAFTRVSSGYSMNRLHPVYKTNRPHQGVDYAAPAGTPIKAVGDGTITKLGWSGGYGNTILIKHVAGLESQYAHMSGFAKGLKNGAKVKQGQVIGYVGATGTATGPHLDFRIKQNGNFINPSKVIIPREDPLNKQTMPLFEEYKTLAQSYFAGDKQLAEYTPPDFVEEATKPQ